MGVQVGEDDLSWCVDVSEGHSTALGLLLQFEAALKWLWDRIPTRSVRTGARGHQPSASTSLLFVCGAASMSASHLLVAGLPITVVWPMVPAAGEQTS